MGRTPTRLREITYALSPMKTGVMHGLFKDWAKGMGKRVSDSAVDAGVFCALPLAATVWYVMVMRASVRACVCARVCVFVCARSCVYARGKAFSWRSDQFSKRASTDEIVSRVLPCRYCFDFKEKEKLSHRY